MSRLHRSVEKAEREGLLQWTRPLEGQRQTTTVEDPPAPQPVETVDAHVPPVMTFESPRWEPSELPPDDPRVSGPLFSPLFVAATEPGSAAAEQYRLLRTRLEARDATRRTQLLLVTSPKLGDGKTTTAANLALTMAREVQHKVVLVEADLRRPSLAAGFGIEAEQGLVDVLIGALPLEDALIKVPDHDLVLLPAGTQAASSTELLASLTMQRVLDALRARFDRIVVDTPPVGLSDTHVLARLADGILVVVRAGVTPRPALERALASMDRERLLGIVLNEVDDVAGGYAYPAGYGGGSWD
jgi:capsular exopolysaccharide synthesis family protein